MCFQLQYEPISRTNSIGKYHGMKQAMKCMVKEEGLRALWKGHVPAQILSIGFGIVEAKQLYCCKHKISLYICP